MFTGIIESIGTVAATEHQGGDLRLTVRTGKLSMDAVAIGDSIATSGVCLTVIEMGDDHYVADVSGETLALTTVGDWHPGDAVNLERALTPTTRLGGHLVSGHVDGLGEVVERRPDARSVRFTIRAPDAIARYIAAKGSVCVDGVSLTVNSVDGNRFTLNIVPHTLQETTLSGYTVGHKVNLEVDIIARHLERLLSFRGADDDTPISKDFLAQHGFLGEH